MYLTDTATPEHYTLSLHDALPICDLDHHRQRFDHEHATHDHQHQFLAHDHRDAAEHGAQRERADVAHEHHRRIGRSEEHTSELQSRLHLVCRLLLEKKKPSHICHL